MRYILILIIFLSSSVHPILGNTNNIISIHYSPNNFEQGHNITISLSFNDSSKIIKITSYYCRIYPEYFCHLPPLHYKQNNNSNIFSTSFINKENNSQLAGFNLHILYNDNSTLVLPSNSSQNFNLEIFEIDKDIHYFVLSNPNFNYTTFSSPNSSNSSDISELLTIKPLFTLILITLILRLNKKRIR